MCLISRLERQAFKAARHSNGRCKHVAFIVKRNKILSIGTNDCVSTHPKAADYYDYFKIHAEFDAINKSNLSSSEFRRCSIFVFRVSRDYQNLMYSRPCSSCLKLIKNCGIKSIYYSTKSGIIKL